MADPNRFDNLESSLSSLPGSVQTAISQLRRFETLEIAGSTLAIPTLPVTLERVLCPSCGQANEKGRDVCWACFKPLAAPIHMTPEPDQEVCLVLDGVSYRSTDSGLPSDIQELIARIRKEGYSQKLLNDWQTWRAARGNPPPAAPDTRDFLQRKPDLDRVQAFRGQRVSILRIDGKIYKSDDSDLPPEIQEIFGFIEKEGITPPLMQHLRLYGTKVKYRPLSTPLPSDGDHRFWDAAKKALNP